MASSFDAYSDTRRNRADGRDELDGEAPGRTWVSPHLGWYLKEALRAIFAGDLSEKEVGILIDRFCSKASRSGLKPFVTAAKTIRKRKAGILAAVKLGINNAQHEGLNRRVRLIVNRAYGFHSVNAALGLIMLTLGPITHVLPHERQQAANP